MSVSRCVLTSNYSSPVIPHRFLVLSLPLISPSPTSLSLPSSLSVSFVSLLSPLFSLLILLFCLPLSFSFHLLFPSFSHSFSFFLSDTFIPLLRSWHISPTRPILFLFIFTSSISHLETFSSPLPPFFLCSPPLLLSSFIPPFSLQVFAQPLHHHPVFHICPISLSFLGLCDFSPPLLFLLSISTLPFTFSPPLPPFPSSIHPCPLPPI